jgi:hypothetical protein
MARLGPRTEPGGIAFGAWRPDRSVDHSLQPIRRLKAADPLSWVLWVTNFDTSWQARLRAKFTNFAKGAAIFKKHEQARFPMPVTSGLGVSAV